mmetsp:Transcript_34927/g.92503  ORF Transcript_34927/g.92503 Transcript_34927/m.92503 type:complete len:228 (+) Transcript_34927:1038-1721(+)
MPIRCSERAPSEGSSLRGASRSASWQALVPCLRRLPCLQRLGSTPTPSVFRIPLKSANFRRSSPTASAKKGSMWSRLASSLKVGPSSTRHTTSCLELALMENSERALRSKERSPKWSLSCSLNSSSLPGPLQPTHSPCTTTYHTFCWSPSCTMQSPCLKVCCRKFCASSWRSLDSRPCRMSTSLSHATIRSVFSCCLRSMMRRKAAWLTCQTTESSRATAVEVRGAW